VGLNTTLLESVNFLYEQCRQLGRLFTCFGDQIGVILLIGLWGWTSGRTPLCRPPKNLVPYS